VRAIFISTLVVLTSVGAYFFGIRRLRLTGRTFGIALGKMLESVGITLIFMVVNLVAAVATVLAMRSLTTTFVSIYVTDDVVWVGLSLLQGLTFQWWRELSVKPRYSGQ